MGTPVLSPLFTLKPRQREGVGVVLFYPYPLPYVIETTPNPKPRRASDNAMARTGCGTLALFAGQQQPAD
jgi:hypothetical protein